MNLNRTWIYHVGVFSFVVLLGLVSASCNTTQPTANTPVNPEPVGETVIASPTPAPATEPAPQLGKTTIYRVGSDSEGMGQLKPVEIELNPAEPASAVLAINKMAEIEDSPLPKGTKARTVRFEGGLATVDLTKEVMEIAGDRSEALMFNAILATLGQFPDVRQVQFLVEGEKTQIGGTKDTLEPLNVPSEFVRTATNTATP